MNIEELREYSMSMDKMTEKAPLGKLAYSYD